MSLSLQNLRSETPGVTPSSLKPGQICFNVADRVMFVGDGSSFFTSFDGTQSPAPAGSGWFALPQNLSGFSENLLENPDSYSPAPLDGQVLLYSSVVGKPVWGDLPETGKPTVYLLTNAEVQSAPGSTTSDKISAASGGTPTEADSAIVSGVPGDAYQGLYFFQNGSWNFAAGYAEPLASEVPYDNTLSGLPSLSVQGALDALAAGKLNVASNLPSEGYALSWSSGQPVWVDPSNFHPSASEVSFDPSGTGLPPFADTVQEALSLTWDTADNAQTNAIQAATDATAAQNTANFALDYSTNALTEANNAVSIANNALGVANAALPLTGGTMTGDIVFNDGQPVDAGLF